VPRARCRATDDGGAVATPCRGSLTGGLSNGTGTFVYNTEAVDEAGNRTTASATYSVVYSFRGFFSGIGRDGDHRPARSFEAGTTVRVRFRLKTSEGRVVKPTTKPQWLAPARLPSGHHHAARSIDMEVSNSLFTWRKAHNVWTYEWRTTEAQQGHRWRIGVSLDDGEVIYAVVSLE
jgi:hypothetical protein